MNNRTSFALLAILTLGAFTISSAYALEKAYPGIDGDIRESANQMLLADIPISIWTDQTSYSHNSMIKVTGYVANVSNENPVTLTVTNPANSIVTIAQIQPDNVGNFETMLSTKGNLWKYDGTYIIKVNYGSPVKSNKVLVEITDNVDDRPTTMPGITDSCTNTEISADGYCIPFKISGGTVTDASINAEDKSIIFKITSNNDGMLMVNPSSEIIEGIMLVFVDGEEWDDIEIDGNMVTVMFHAGAEKIEIIGAWVIPEFGTIAVMILAVSIIAIIAVSARTKLGIIPRY